MKVKISVKKLYEMEQLISEMDKSSADYVTEFEEYQDKVAAYREKVADLTIECETLNNRLADAEASLTRKEETINYLTDENDALKRKNKYMNQVIGKLMDKIPKETLSPEEKQWCDLEEQLWKDREEFMKDEDPMDG